MGAGKILSDRDKGKYIDRKKLRGEVETKTKRVKNSVVGKVGS